MARTQMSISVKEQDDIFDIIIHNPYIVNWRSIGRCIPSADEKCDADHFFEENPDKCMQLEKKLLDTVFKGAKWMTYSRKSNLVAILFKNNNGTSLKNTLISIRNGNREPLSYSDLK